VLKGLSTAKPTLELISLEERESLYPVEEEVIRHQSLIRRLIRPRVLSSSSLIIIRTDDGLSPKTSSGCSIGQILIIHNMVNMAPPEL